MIQSQLTKEGHPYQIRDDRLYVDAKFLTLQSLPQWQHLRGTA